MRLALFSTLAFLLSTFSALAAGPALQPPLTLVNANTGAQVPFVNGINLDPAKGKLWFVIAPANAQSSSAKFQLDADAATFDNDKPFTSLPGLPPNGAHALKITPYSRNDLGGILGAAITIKFTIGPTPTPTPSPSVSPTPDPTPSATPTPTQTPSPTPSASPTPSPTPTPEPTPTPTASPDPSATPSSTPTPEPSPSPTPPPSPTPSATPSPSSTPSPSPSATPIDGAHTYLSDGTLADTQAKVNQSVPGDFVIIPAGNFTWNAALNVPSKNIHLLGVGMDSTKLLSGGTTQTLIHFTCENVSRNTAVIGAMELFGELDKKLSVDGVAVPHELSDGSVDGGIRIHDINFSSSYATSGDSIRGHHYVQQGWVFGVMDHCKIDDKLQRVGGETMIINHNTDPQGNGGNGDYAFSFPTDGSDVAGTINAMYFEDNIWHHPGGVSDTGSGFGGGGIKVERHNTSWGSNAGHGTRESGGAQHGQRLGEEYNNLHVYDNGIGETKSSICPSQARDGEVVKYNNFISNVGTLEIAAMTHWTAIAAFANSTVPNYDRWGLGADSLNPWDENQKGDFTDGLGFAHSVDENYSYSSAASTVANGVDQDSRFGDVYAHASGGNVAGVTMTGATIAGTNIPSPIPDNYFRGFIIRDADAPRSRQNPTCFAYILSSKGTTLTFEGSNPAFASHPSFGPSAHMEIRRVKTYYCIPGSAQSDSLIATNSNPASLASGNPNPRWTNQQLGGFWVWGNQHRLSASQSGAPGPWKNEVALALAGPGGDYQFVVRGFHQIFGYPTNIQPSQTKPGYSWDPTTPAGSPETRIGADWTTTFSDGVSNTGVFASFYSGGSGGYKYPHPLTER